MGDLGTDISANEDEPKNKIFKYLCPCTLSSTLDLVGHQKCIKKGGGSITTELFLMFCDESRRISHVLKAERCEIFFQVLHNDIENWKCYHKRGLITAHVEEMRMGVFNSQLPLENQLI